MGRVSFCVAGTGIVTAALGQLFALHLRKVLDVGKQLKFNDDACYLLDLPEVVEDLTSAGDGHCVFGGGGSLTTAFKHGTAGIEPGRLWKINVTSGKARELRVHPRPSWHTLHGIYFSQTSRRLYAVNHDDARGESIELFQEVSGIDGESSDYDFKHIASVGSTEFRPYAMNDVVEGLNGEFYVSEWLRYGKPVGGEDKPAKSFQEHLEHQLTVFGILTKSETTKVFRCHLDESPHCRPATGNEFVMANGLAVSDDRQVVYVADPPQKTVHAMQRQGDGSLKKIRSFVTRHSIDNLEMAPDGVLHAGAAALGFSTQTACAAGLGKEATVDGRQVGCGSSPGALVQIRLNATAQDARGQQQWTLEEDSAQVDVLVHDGSKLSDVSSGIQVNSKVVALSSPDSKGVLICTVSA